MIQSCTIPLPSQDLRAKVRISECELSLAACPGLLRGVCSSCLPPFTVGAPPAFMVNDVSSPHISVSHLFFGNLTMQYPSLSVVTARGCGQSSFLPLLVFSSYSHSKLKDKKSRGKVVCDAKKDDDRAVAWCVFRRVQPVSPAAAAVGRPWLAEPASLTGAATLCRLPAALSRACQAALQACRLHRVLMPRIEGHIAWRAVHTRWLWTLYTSSVQKRERSISLTWFL